MKLDLSQYKIHLVLSPVDMRQGFRGLSLIAESCLGIDVSKGADCLVFVSSRRLTCKVIWCDDKGCVVMGRSLMSGRFAKFLARCEESDASVISVDELMTFLDGGSLQVERTNFGQGPVRT